MDITSRLLESSPSRAPLTMYSEWAWQPGDQEAIRRFLKHVVPYVTAKMKCRDGIIAQIPTPRPSYTQHSPMLPVSKYSDQILRQIRKTAAFSILFMRGENTLNTKQASAARRVLAQVVAQFKDDPHWENSMALALSYHVDGEFDEAIRYYRNAKCLIEEDSNVVDDPSWQATVRDIEKQISRAEGKEPA